MESTGRICKQTKRCYVYEQEMVQITVKTLYVGLANIGSFDIQKLVVGHTVLNMLQNTLSVPASRYTAPNYAVPIEPVYSDLLYYEKIVSGNFQWCITVRNTESTVVNAIDSFIREMRKVSSITMDWLTTAKNWNKWMEICYKYQQAVNEVRDVQKRPYPNCHYR